jgi:outer membrane protein
MRSVRDRRETVAARIGRTLAGFAVCFLVTASARAEIVDLDRAIARALAHNPELRAHAAQRDAAQAQRRAADSARLPQVGMHYSARSSDGALDAFSDRLLTGNVSIADFDPARLNNPERSTLYAAQLVVTFPLYAGGRLVADTASAAQQAQARQLHYERAREILAFETLRAYHDTQAANAARAIVDDAVRTTDDHVRTIAQLVREGRAVKSDRLSAEVALANYRSMHAQATTRAARALDTLKRLMNATPANDVEVAPTLPEIGLSAPRERAAMEQDALATRKDIAGTRALLDAARHGIESARAAYKPRVNLVGASNWYGTDAMPDNQSSSVMGIVSFDLYTGGRHRADVDEAVAGVIELEWRAQAVEARSRDEIRAAADALRESTTRLELARANVEKAHEAAQLVNQRYGQGRTILIDLLQSERAWMEARQEALAAHLGVLVNDAALRLAEGTLTPPPETGQ